MSALEWIVIVVFAVWFVFTVGYQFWFEAMYPWVCRFDWFHLLPALNYFSVVPRLLRLSYRDRLRDGAVGEWRRLSLASNGVGGASRGTRTSTSRSWWRRGWVRWWKARRRSRRGRRSIWRAATRTGW